MDKGPSTSSGIKHSKRKLEDAVDMIASKKSRVIVNPADLEDNQKRWLVVGICLHSIISPALRKHVASTLKQLYETLCVQDKIDTQTYQTRLKRYPSTGKEGIYLNYEAVNKNKDNNGYNKQNYDYEIKNAVDLSKLFLKTDMANYKGFDEICDSSTLLGLINKVDLFVPVVKNNADNVRKQTQVLAEYAKLVATETDNDFVMIKKNLGNFEKLLSNKVDHLKKDMDRGFSEIDKKFVANDGTLKSHATQLEKIKENLYLLPCRDNQSLSIRSSLRSLTNDFIGRDDDISKIIESLQTKKVVVVLAPYGFGTSEIVVAVGHQFNATSVVHADMRDIGHTVSGKLITLFGLNPLPDTIAQLKTICPYLTNTLLIFDNLDYIFEKKEHKSDFESTVRVLTDDALCKDVKVLCATQQSFSLLQELGFEHRLTSLNNRNSTKLLIKLCPEICYQDAQKLATASMGIPLAIHLIKDLYKSGHHPQAILSGIKEDIGNITAVVGLEEKKELIAISLQYIKSQEPKTQEALKTLSYVFSGSFDELSAKALLLGTEFAKQDTLLRLKGNSLLHFDNAQKRLSIHPFYRRLVNEKEMISMEIKQTAFKRHANYFIQIINTATTLWFSKDSSNALKLLRSEQHNIFNLFEMSKHNCAHVIDNSSMLLLLDTSVVNTLYEVFKGNVLIEFFGQIQNSISHMDNPRSEEDIGLLLKECLVHLNVKEGQYAEVDMALLIYDFDKIQDTFPAKHAIRFLLDKAIFFIHKNSFNESAQSLVSVFKLLNEHLMKSSADNLIVCLGELLWEVSFLFYTYFHDINTKRKQYPTIEDSLWIEDLQEKMEISMLVDQLQVIEMPFKYNSPIEIDRTKSFCRSPDLQICLHHILEVAIEAQSKSLSIYVHLLGDNHTLTGFCYDRLAFLLHNREHYEKSIEYRNKAITVRKVVLDGYHPDIAWSFYGLGNSLELLGRLNEALDAYKLSVGIRKSYLGNHYLTAKSYFKVGHIYSKLNQFDEALDALSKTVEMRKVVNDDAESVARALCVYGDLLVSSDDKELKEKAEFVYQEENKYRLEIANNDEEKRLDLYEDERTGQGAHGWGRRVLDLDNVEEENKQLDWIRMQVSNQNIQFANFC
ncbi:Hypothetical predicted protein [Mytilus galloprovincialis]|uniref:Uncharacterized protein n=2 Tax=Mytilus galloprovincialis TaxID=29158 RepID=A0A8B6HQC9_MYTGA|nr:Hypothetical predicted protein [Mytilus galloprovincialis]